MLPQAKNCRLRKLSSFVQRKEQPMNNRTSDSVVVTTTTSGSPSTSCGSTPGEITSTERVRYFARQLITADDLTQEQNYIRAKMRRHNRMLHGWGVVCGCAVTPNQNDYTVCIQPGYALSPQGDEILIDRTIAVDLSQQGLDGNAATVFGADADPWCSTVRVDLRLNSQLYIAIAYSEMPTRPVRVQSSGCGCDGSQCEYSRIRDGYIVRILSALPDSYTRQPPSESAIFSCTDGIRACPECISDPWVILARVTVAGKQIGSNDIDNVHYRRNVASFGDWWFSCQDNASQPTVAPAQPATLAPGQQVRIQPERVGAAPAEARVATGPLAGRMVRLRRQAEPGAMEIPAEASTQFVAAFDTQSLARTADAPLRVEGVRILAIQGGSPDAALVELGNATTTGQTVAVSGAPNGFEARFTNAPLAFDSVDTSTFRVTAAGGSDQPGKIVILANNSVRLQLDAALGSGSYTVTLVGVPKQPNGPAITSHQGMALEGDGKTASDFSFVLNVA
jgi:hypothetical protein